MFTARYGLAPVYCTGCTFICMMLVFKWITNEISLKQQQIKLNNSNLLDRTSIRPASDAGLSNKNFPTRLRFVMPQVLTAQAMC